MFHAPEASVRPLVGTSPYILHGSSLPFQLAWQQTGSALQRDGLGDYNSYSSVIFEVTGLDDRAEAGL
jgi:hypothetical protein